MQILGLDLCDEEYDGNLKQVKLLAQDQRVYDRLKSMEAYLSYENILLFGICLLLSFIVAIVLSILFKMFMCYTIKVAQCWYLIMCTWTCNECFDNFQIYDKIVWGCWPVIDFLMYLNAF